MLTGSIVSSIQGEPRLSHDIDIIIDCNQRFVSILYDNFNKDAYYFDDAAINEAIANQFMFNLIEMETGDKIDFWILTDSAFDNSRFARRIKVELFEETAFISSPEDTMLAKMLWAKKSGGSEKQLTDVRQVFKCNAATIDYDYIEKWSLILGVKHLWDAIGK
jgi:hypothetical protein